MNIGQLLLTALYSTLVVLIVGIFEVKDDPNNTEIRQNMSERSTILHASART